MATKTKAAQAGNTQNDLGTAQSDLESAAAELKKAQANFIAANTRINEADNAYTRAVIHLGTVMNSVRTANKVVPLGS